MKNSYLVLLIILLFIVLCFYIINHYQENFSDYAINYCTTTTGTMGIRMNDGTCISLGSQQNTTKKSTQIKSGSEKSGSYMGLEQSTSSEQQETLSDTLDPTSVRPNPTDQNQCITKNSDYGQVCKLRYGSQSGVDKIEECDSLDTNSVKITCSNMTFNGKDYSNDGSYVFSTECIDKSLDFDDMCNSYMLNSIKDESRPNGYNVYSAGVSEKLIGIEGSCYLNNGESDQTKARGICNLKSNQTLPRLSPYTYVDNHELNDYNKFTDCKNIETGEFVEDCQRLLDVTEDKVYADINGYDCLPGYGRAKCVDTSKKVSLSPDMKKFKFDSKTTSFF